MSATVSALPAGTGVLVTGLLVISIPPGTALSDGGIVGRTGPRDIGRST